MICSDSRTSMVSQKMQYHSKLEPSSTCSKNRLYCDLTKILTGALSSTWNKPTDQTRINLSNIFIEKVLSTEFPFTMPIVLCARPVHRRKSLKTTACASTDRRAVCLVQTNIQEKPSRHENPSNSLVKHFAIGPAMTRELAYTWALIPRTREHLRRGVNVLLTPAKGVCIGSFFVFTSIGIPRTRGCQLLADASVSQGQNVEWPQLES